MSEYPKITTNLTPHSYCIVLHMCEWYNVCAWSWCGDDDCANKLKPGGGRSVTMWCVSFQILEQWMRRWRRKWMLEFTFKHPHFEKHLITHWHTNGLRGGGWCSLRIHSHASIGLWICSCALIHTHTCSHTNRQIINGGGESPLSCGGVNCFFTLHRFQPARYVDDARAVQGSTNCLLW